MVRSSMIIGTTVFHRREVIRPVLMRGIKIVRRVAGCFRCVRPRR